MSWVPYRYIAQGHRVFFDTAFATKFKNTEKFRIFNICKFSRFKGFEFAELFDTQIVFKLNLMRGQYN
jgi:hypothetical protein